MDWVLAEWDDADAIDDPDPGNLGIYNPRDIYGNQWPNWKGVGSQHARGAALDVRFPTVVGGHPEGWKFARWLVENHAILGIQEVIYGGNRWTNRTKQWRAYNGPSPHNDHVHCTLNASGARYLTVARIESVAPHAPAPPQEDDDMPKPFMCRFGTSPVVLYVGADRQVHWVRSKEALPGYALQLGLDRPGDGENAGKVCVLAKRNADGSFSSSQQHLIDLALMVENLPFLGAMPSGWSAWWKGPQLPSAVAA